LQRHPNSAKAGATLGGAHLYWVIVDGDGALCGAYTLHVTLT